MRVESSRELPLTPATDPQPLLCRPVHELPALTVQPVSTASTARLWNEYIARYDYLGYTPLSGSQMRYEILAGSQRVALISFGASAWKLAAREHFIGWNEAQRQRNLQLVINNARFLVLPWIQSKGLASKILALIARQLPHDWQQRYGYRPVLFETFVETPRHRGICYKAANWNPHRADRRSRQKVPRSPARPAGQGHLVLPALQALPRHTLQLAAAGTHGFTEYLPKLSVVPGSE
jgi:hypothetical protein